MSYQYRVEFELVKKELKKLPSFVVVKLQKWAQQVEQLGLPEVRKVPGLHDEPLKGNRAGQRSIRLSKGYRAIYQEDQNKQVVLVVILEVNKHEY